MPSGIFVSYRRQDSQMAAGRLADCIKEEFGDAEIFRDVENIDPGADFTEVLSRALNSCVVMLVVIGPQWLTIADKNGRRRLDSPSDWTRVEVATALQRNIRVIPVLLENTPMPEEAELPPDLAKLALRQALDLSDKRWTADTDKLMDTLARIPGLKRRQAAGPPPLERAPEGLAQVRRPLDSAVGRVKKVFMWIGGVMVGLVVLGLFVEEDTPAPSATPTPAPAPAPVPAVAATPDLGGLWHSRSGETYAFTQQGANLAFSILVGGNTVGQGAGSVQAGAASLAMNVLFAGQPVTLACEMQLAPDHRAMAGTCVNNLNGQVSPAQIFR
jgi:hypothetical protein